MIMKNNFINHTVVFLILYNYDALIIDGHDIRINQGVVLSSGDKTIEIDVFEGGFVSGQSVGQFGMANTI